jgi:hypothetical protein
MTMKFREFQHQISVEVHRISALEDLVTYLQRTQIPSPIEDGVVPDEVKQSLISELRSKIQVSELRVGELEDVDVELPDTGNVVVLGGPRGPRT